MPKPAAGPRLFVVLRRHELKKPDSLDAGVESTEHEWIQTHFELDALPDDDNLENNGGILKPWDRSLAQLLLCSF